jgi:UDP-2,3-diacylglucosamine pyrophosphatase LpxH
MERRLMPPKKKRSRVATVTTRAPVPPVPALGHDQILAALEQAFPSGVFLLSRLADPMLRLSDPTPHVFIPDTHIVPGDEIKSWPGHVLTESRVGVLTRLLDTLDRLRAANPELVVWQLGDLLDLWRTGDVPLLSTRERLKLLRSDWGSLIRRFEPDAPMPIRRIFGNHDEDLRSEAGVRERAFVPEDPGDTAGNDMLVTHGHQFDPIEALPAPLKEFFMRGATERITPYVRDFMSATNPQWATQGPDLTFDPPQAPRATDRAGFVCPELTSKAPVPLAADVWNVRDIRLITRPDANPLNVSTGPSVVQDDQNPSLWAMSKVQAREAGHAGYSVALVVVGHTHNPRIMRGRQLDGSPFVLMDCGGWIGPRFLSPEINQMVHNCTIGVRVGSDLRLYQLTADSYEWPL